MRNKGYPRGFPLSVLKSSLFSTVEDTRRIDIGRVFSDLGVSDTRYIKSSLFTNQLTVIVEGEDDVKYIKLLIDKVGFSKEINQCRVGFAVTGETRFQELILLIELTICLPQF